MKEAVIYFSPPPVPYIVSCGPGLYEPGEAHNGRQGIGVFDLIVVCKGTLYLTEDDRQFDIPEGHWFILRPDRYHYSHKPCTTQTRFYWIHFRTAGNWEEIFEEGPAANRQLSHLSEGNRYMKDAFTIFHYSIQIPKFRKLPYAVNTYRQLDQLLELELKALPTDRWQQQILFEELLRDMHQEHVSGEDKRLIQLADHVATFLRRHYKEPFTNEKLGEIFHFHPGHIARCMRKIFGCTPAEYLQRYRLEQGKLLLLQTNWPITRVAEEVGFEQLPYFTRFFRKYEGLTPSQFRENNRGGLVAAERTGKLG